MVDRRYYEDRVDVGIFLRWLGVRQVEPDAGGLKRDCAGQDEAEEGEDKERQAEGAAEVRFEVGDAARFGGGHGDDEFGREEEW